MALKATGVTPREFKSLPRRFYTSLFCQLFHPSATFVLFITLGRQEDLEERFMCIAVPAEVIEIRDGNIGLVDFGDLQHEVRLDLVDVKVGEFVLVHVGFAIQRLSREEGLETREIFRQVYEAMGA